MGELAVAPRRRNVGREASCTIISLPSSTPPSRCTLAVSLSSLSTASTERHTLSGRRQRIVRFMVHQTCCVWHGATNKFILEALVNNAQGRYHISRPPRSCCNSASPDPV